MEATRTLIITGFKTPEEMEEYRSTIFNPDEMAEYYTAPNTNILFLVFYDVRKATAFKEEFKDQGLNINHTISKHELPRKAEECSEKNKQSTIMLQFYNVEISLEDEFITGFLKPYGEIRKMKPGSTNVRIVEFFDSRDAEKAFKALNGSLFGDGKIQCFWCWDIPTATRMEYIKQADEAIKKCTLCVETAVKRPRLAENSSKNMFIDLFDQFIAKNILEIEKMFR